MPLGYEIDSERSERKYTLERFCTAIFTVPFGWKGVKEGKGKMNRGGKETRIEAK